MKKKQTAVEFLAEEIKKHHPFWIDIIKKAKEMEKEQMIEFARAFWYYAYGADAPPVYPEDVEKFYKKVFEV